MAIIDEDKKNNVFIGAYITKTQDAFLKSFCKISKKSKSEAVRTCIRAIMDIGTYHILKNLKN